MCGMFDLNVWDNDAEYLVLDDIPFDYIGGSGMRKALWGGQREIVLSDKFHRKRTVTWGKPSSSSATKEIGSHSSPTPRSSRTI